MNTTIVDGVEIKQGDEVECSDYSISGWTKSVFIADLGEGYTCRYITTLDTTLDSFITNKYIRPIPKKQRVPLTQEDIVRKYMNGFIRAASGQDICIRKILAIGENELLIGDVHCLWISFDMLYSHWEITTGPDSNGVIVWEPCWKEV